MKATLQITLYKNNTLIKQLKKSVRYLPTAKRYLILDLLNILLLFSCFSLSWLLLST